MVSANFLLYIFDTLGSLPVLIIADENLSVLFCIYVSASLLVFFLLIDGFMLKKMVLNASNNISRLMLLVRGFFYFFLFILLQLFKVWNTLNKCTLLNKLKWNAFYFISKNFCLFELHKLVKFCFTLLGKIGVSLFSFVYKSEENDPPVDTTDSSATSNEEESSTVQKHHPSSGQGYILRPNSNDDEEPDAEDEKLASDLYDVSLFVVVAGLVILLISWWRSIS